MEEGESPEQYLHPSLSLAIIFVIDSEDKDRLIIAREELLHLIETLPDGSTIPIIIAANKQDLHGLT